MILSKEKVEVPLGDIVLLFSSNAGAEHLFKSNKYSNCLKMHLKFTAFYSSFFLKFTFKIYYNRQTLRDFGTLTMKIDIKEQYLDKFEDFINSLPKDAVISEKIT